MTYAEHKITLDIHQIVAPVSVRVKKGNTARRLLIHLAERGYPYHISEDCYAVFTAKKPDGKVVFNNCIIEECVIRYDFTEQTVAAVGLVDSEIILYGSDGKQLTSASFHIIVEDTIYDTDTEIESTDEYNALAELIAEVQYMKERGLMATPIIGEVEGKRIYLSDASNNPLQGLRIFGKSTQAATPTLDNPVEIVSVGAGGSIEAKVFGKNIVSDLTYLTSGTDYASLVKSGDTGAVKKGKLYTISVTLTAEKETKAYWNSVSGFFEHEFITISAGTKRYSRTFIAMADGDTGTSRIILSKSATGDSVTITPSDCQIELGAVATDYEISAGQSVVISTPGGLPGIPVTSGGNYTDSDGQQWICDEVDLARGVRIQRIATLILSTLSTWARGTGNGWANASAFYSTGALSKAVSVEGYETKANILCNRLVVGLPSKIAGQTVNRVGQGTGTSVFVSIEGIETAEDLIAYLDENETIVYYVLATPIETALTEAEIAAYAALRTYKPNTTIYNDAGAFMAAEYVADTKQYIDRNGVGGSSVVLGEVTLRAANWVGAGSPYSQVVQIAGVTEYSQVDLKPSVEQLAIFHEKDLAFVTENENGVVTVYAIGDRPTNDYTMQVSITEVNL